MGLKKQFVSAFLLGSALTAPLFAQDIATPSSSIDTLAIFSFNDFHGAFASDGITPGAARLVQMTQNEKQRYPHSIVVSGGDNFSGSYFSKITKGEPIKEMYEAMDVEMSAIGNHEFDWGLPYLVDTAALNIPHVAANITEEKRYTHPDWLSPYRIVERKLKDGSSLLHSLHRTDHDGHLRQDQAGEPERASVHASAGSGVHTNRLPVKERGPDRYDYPLDAHRHGYENALPHHRGERPRTAVHR